MEQTPARIEIDKAESERDFATATAIGIDELDRGKSVDLEDVLEQARAIVNAVERRRSTRGGLGTLKE